MTATYDFERLLGSVLDERGPQTVDGTVIEAALAVARQHAQRRPVVTALDRRAWPTPRMSIANPRAARLATLGLVALLTLAIIAASLFVGSLVPPRQPELPGAWTHTSQPGTQRDSRVDGFGMAVMPDGRVLFVGGTGPDPASAEIYDPVTNAFAPTANSAGDDAWRRDCRRPAGRQDAGVRLGVIRDLRSDHPDVRSPSRNDRRPRLPHDDRAGGRSRPRRGRQRSGRRCHARLRRGLRPVIRVVVAGRLAAGASGTAHRHAPCWRTGPDHRRHHRRRLGIAAQERGVVRSLVGTIHAGRDDGRWAGFAHRNAAGRRAGPRRRRRDRRLLRQPGQRERRALRPGRRPLPGDWVPCHRPLRSRCHRVGRRSSPRCGRLERSWRSAERRDLQHRHRHIQRGRIGVRCARRSDRPPGRWARPDRRWAAGDLRSCGRDRGHAPVTTSRPDLHGCRDAVPGQDGPRRHSSPRWPSPDRGRPRRRRPRDERGDLRPDVRYVLADRLDVGLPWRQPRHSPRAISGVPAPGWPGRGDRWRRVGVGRRDL